MNQERFISSKIIKPFYEDFLNNGKLARKIISDQQLDTLFGTVDGVRSKNPTSVAPLYPFRWTNWSASFPTGVSEYKDQAKLASAKNDWSYHPQTILGMTRKSRIIIHKVEIFFNPNVVDAHKDFVTFSLKRVKKSLFAVAGNDSTTNNLGGKSIYISPSAEQFVTDNTFFTNSIVLDNLHWDLPLTDDIILVQQITLDQTLALKYKSPINFVGLTQCFAGLATNHHSHYNIIVHWSYPYMGQFNFE